MRRVLLSILPLVVMCLLLEVVLRTTHVFNARLSWTEPDRQIGWRFTPGHEYWFFQENDHPITGRINGAGWRDRERAAAKTPGTTRIAVLGDSFVEAFQVESDSTFVSVLERTLNTRGAGTYEAMNFGRSGMSPAEELIVLERDVLPCRPDVVVLLFTPQNDIADVNPLTTTDPCRPFFHNIPAVALAPDTSFVERRDFRMREIINPFKQHSALVSLVTERYNAARLARAQRALAPAGVALTREQRMCTASPDSMYAANYALCRELIARMAQACSSRGIRFVLASVPLVYEERAIRELRTTDGSFDADFFDRDLGAFASTHGFDFIALGAGFKERNRTTGETLHWRHWNYAGHRLVASQLAAGLAGPPAGAPSQTIDRQ